MYTVESGSLKKKNERFLKLKCKTKEKRILLSIDFIYHTL